MTQEQIDALLVECAPHLTPLLGKVLDALLMEHARAESLALACAFALEHRPGERSDGAGTIITCTKDGLAQ